MSDLVKIELDDRFEVLGICFALFNNNPLPILALQWFSGANFNHQSISTFRVEMYFYLLKKS